MRRYFISTLIAGGLVFVIRAGVEYLNPQYWDPKTFIDYLAIVMTSIQDILFSLVLLIMLKLEPFRKELNKKIWWIAMGFASLGSFVSGIGNFLEDAIGITQIGNIMYSYGGMGGAISLIIAFVFALSIFEIRSRWSWFYILPLIGVVLFSDFGGFITGLAMLTLSVIEIRDHVSQNN